MKDGKKVASERQMIPKTLASLGWQAFLLPVGMFDTIIQWAYDNLGGDSSMDNVCVGIVTVSIRRAEDAVLFRVSWPECTPISQKVVMKLNIFNNSGSL